MHAFSERVIEREPTGNSANHGTGGSMNDESIAYSPAAADTLIETALSRRDSLKLAAAALAAPLLSALPRTATGAESSSPTHSGARKGAMSMIKVGQENSTPIELYYEDHGSGSPVVLIHGWPLSGASWEKQTAALLAAGHRVVTYDRRGFGRSGKPAVGYNYDTFASDLNTVLTSLDLTGVSLVGFSMGTGEVSRYIGKYGTKRLRKAVLIGTLGPYLLKAADNPEGVDASVFDGIKAAIKADRPAFLIEFLRNFYNYDITGGKLVSERVLEDNWNVAAGASAIGTLACVDAWIEDFRKDIPRNNVPTLILHGDTDRILPPDATSRRQAKMIKGVKFVELKGGPHGVLWTHADQVNAELVKFLA
jgi:pimeloyl-ACP methyl ester carboxylesterase